MGGARTSKTLYETFYVGEGGTQYFIKPVTFEGTNSEVKLDMTFRYKNEIKDSATFNFTIKDGSIFKQVDSVIISDGTNKYNLDRTFLLFNEKMKKDFLSRYSSYLPFENLVELIKHDSWTITIYANEKVLVYNANKRTKKIFRKLNEQLFVIF